MGIMDRWAAFLMKTGANREKQNLIWNMAGSFFYAFASMVLSFLESLPLDSAPSDSRCLSLPTLESGPFR